MTQNSGNSVVQNLIGLVLTSVNVTSDFVRLLFQGEWELVIYNPIALDLSGVSISMGDGSILIGKVVITTVTSRDEFLLQLSGAVSLRVDLRDEVFIGPEAMQLIGAAGEIVVWN